jgi:putative (di)nucleoside polyphosphate hydrolase
MSREISMLDHLPYRPGVGIMLLNQENQVFVGKRIDTRMDAWQMPQGGIDFGETPEEAVLRELAEETGTRNAEIIAQSEDWHYYDLPEHLVTKLWDGKYRGQKQKWFLLRFLGNDNDITIATDEPEFEEWRWTDAKTLPDIIVPFKRDLYVRILREFGEYF